MVSHPDFNVTLICLKKKKNKTKQNVHLIFFGVSDYRCGEERDGEKKIKDER